METKFATTERVLAGAGFAVFAAGCFIVGFFNPSTAGIFPGVRFSSLQVLPVPGAG